MRFKLVKLNKLSGNKASIYSVYLEKEGETLFDIFLEENKILFKSELKDRKTKNFQKKTISYANYQKR